LQCWGCGEPHYYKNCPHPTQAKPGANIQEVSIVGHVERSILRINASLEDRQAEYQPTMVELEGKILNHHVSILIDPGVSLSYISPKIVDLCHMERVKFKNPWLAQLAIGAKQ